MVTRKLLVALLLVVPTNVLAAPEVLHVDLASERSVTVPVRPGTYSIEIDNLVPHLQSSGWTYQVVILQEAIPIPPLTLPTRTGPQGAVACPAFAESLKALQEADNETAAANARRNLQSLLADAIAKGCTEVRAALDYMGRMVWGPSSEAYVLKSGERLQVTVTRTNGQQAVTWVKVFTTGSAGEWIASYGFTFLPNRDETYFSKTKASAGQFVVTPTQGNEGLDFTPAVFFTWFPASNGHQTWVFGGTAGLGFELSTPAIFAGLSMMYHENVQLVLGVAVNQQLRLNGQYSKGETISENLSRDQLSSKAYRPNWFLGLTFRFDKNPFQSSAPSGSQAPASAKQPSS
jgi:hypothetical protein